MASIRSQLRVRFALTISFLLLACSLAIWLWGRYLANRQVYSMLQQDARRLEAAITWNPDLAAFELRMSPSASDRHLTSDYWQVCDFTGKPIWTNDNEAGLNLSTTAAAAPGSVCTVQTASGKNWFALRDAVQRSRLHVRPRMLQEFPDKVLDAAREIGGVGDITATELEFMDDQLVYEFTFRRGEDLIEVCMDGAGRIVERSQHRVPTALPEPVLRKLERESPGARVRSFDWRATQGRLQFIVDAAAADGTAFRRCITSTGDAVPLYFPADANGGRATRFDILVASPHKWRSELLSKLGLLLVGVCGAGLGATLIISAWLTHRTLGPIGRLAREAECIDDRRLSERLQVTNPEDEIGQLARAINGMLDRIETAFERQRRFARDASHELRGPLTGLIAHLELARSVNSETGDGHLGLALERAQRLHDLVEKLLLLARQDSDQPVGLRDDVDLQECLRHVAADFPAGQQRRIELLPAEAGAEEPLVRANEELLHSMFRNIIENALKFSPAGSPVRVRVQARNGWQAVEVQDGGPGIAPELQARVFEPFIRGQGSAAVEGAGLGLSIVRWIAQIHGAQVQVEPVPGGPGTRFTVRMPSAPIAG